MSELSKLSELPWFIIQLRPLGLKRAVDHLHRQDFRTFAPEIEDTTTRTGSLRQTRKPLFPGYLFVSFDPASQGWAAINSTRGASRLILDRPFSPTPLPQRVIAGIMARCDASGLLLPPANLEVGDKIRILAGPFADLVTTIEMLPDQERIGVLIDLMAQKIKMSLPRHQVEKFE